MEKIKLLLYCDKSKPYLFSHFKTKFFTNKKEIYANSKALSLNGKIVAECDYEIEEILKVFDSYGGVKTYYKELEKQSCLTSEQLNNYLKGKNGFAIHIKNLNIFDKPRELKNSGYKVRDRKNDKEMQIFKVDEWQPIAFKYIEKAPQNMCKVYRLNDNEEEYDEYILISIRPEYLVRILNKEKTIEVRKKVLKEMVK